MDKRIRSPNYPAISLPAAIEKAATLYKNIHTHEAPRDVVAKGMGYNSLNGASATAISALRKYGLLDRSGDGVRLSERAMRILHPESPEEKSQAIKAAAVDPGLFLELNERFPLPLPSEELLRNYLIRQGFAPGAVSGAILAYRETMDLVEREGGAYGGASPLIDVGPSMQAETQRHGGSVSPQFTKIIQEDERPLARYDFEGGGYVRVVIGGNLDTESALDMAETLLKLKRAEIVARNAKPKVENNGEE